jgi:CBS domain-containing protein
MAARCEWILDLNPAKARLAMAICAFSIGKVCKDLKVAIDRDQSVLEATRLMRGLEVDTLIVTERSNGKPLSVGPVTAADIVTRVTALGLDPNVLTVGDIAWPAHGPFTEASPARDVLALLSQVAKGAVAVMEHDGEIVGILSVKNLIPALVEQVACTQRATRATTVSAGRATIKIGAPLPEEDLHDTFRASDPAGVFIEAEASQVWLVAEHVRPAPLSEAG